MEYYFINIDNRLHRMMTILNDLMFLFIQKITFLCIFLLFLAADLEEFLNCFFMATPLLLLIFFVVVCLFENLCLVSRCFLFSYAYHFFIALFHFVFKY